MDKSKALDAALSQIERNFGKGSIMRLGKNMQSMDVETVSTGSLGLDIALGIGGLPRGRVVEIYGPESSGKTTLTLQVIAEQLSAAGVPVLMADVKGDLSGLSQPGQSNDKITARAKETGDEWKASAFPVQFLSLGTKGIGVLSKADAINLSCTGPVARASGVVRDLRKDEPYLAYKDFDFKVVCATAGDC